MAALLRSKGHELNRAAASIVASADEAAAQDNNGRGTVTKGGRGRRKAKGRGRGSASTAAVDSVTAGLNVAVQAAESFALGELCTDEAAAVEGQGAGTAMCQESMERITEASLTDLGFVIDSQFLEVHRVLSVARQISPMSRADLLSKTEMATLTQGAAEHQHAILAQMVADRDAAAAAKTDALAATAAAAEAEAVALAEAASAAAADDMKGNEEKVNAKAAATDAAEKAAAAAAAAETAVKEGAGPIDEAFAESLAASFLESEAVPLQALTTACLMPLGNGGGRRKVRGGGYSQFDLNIDLRWLRGRTAAALGPDYAARWKRRRQQRRRERERGTAATTAIASGLTNSDAGSTHVPSFMDNLWYLVKWCGLPYDQVTWEPAYLIHSIAGEEILKFCDRELRMRYQMTAAASSLSSRATLSPPPGGLLAPKAYSRPPVSSFRKVTDEQGSNPAVFGATGELSLRKYQMEGLNWLLFNWYERRPCLLGDEMGLGKTVQTIAFLDRLGRGDAARRYNWYSFEREERERRDKKGRTKKGVEEEGGDLKKRLASGEGPGPSVMGPFLVVVPLSCVNQWESEFNLWAPHLNVVVFHGSALARQAIQKYEIASTTQIKGGGQGGWSKVSIFPFLFFLLFPYLPFPLLLLLVPPLSLYVSFSLSLSLSLSFSLSFFLSLSLSLSFPLSASFLSHFPRTPLSIRLSLFLLSLSLRLISLTLRHHRNHVFFFRTAPVRRYHYYL